MSDRLLLSFLCLLFVFFAAMPASAQKTPQVPVPGADPSSPEDQEPQPEPPRSVLNVEIKNDLLSVELENVDFGTAIRAVADRAGFKIEGSGETFGRKLNTSFTDIEVERGVLRLLSLVHESNYMLHYDTKGMISKLDIFGMSSGRAPSVTARQPFRSMPALRQPAVSPVSPLNQRPATVSPSPQTRPLPPAFRRRPVPARQVPPPQPAVQPSGSAKPEAEEDVNDEEESVDEIPYVAPQPRFTPAPVRKP
jgi:hypothetical protein